MKTVVVRLALFSVSIIVISIMFAGQGDAKIDPETCVGMWLFDEGKGEVAKDASGKGHDGELVGNPKWVAGKFGKALEFDGTNGVQVEQKDDLSLTTFTVQAWIKLEKGGVWQQIVAKHNTPPRNYTVGVSPSNLVECEFTDGFALRHSQSEEVIRPLLEKHL